MPHDLPSLKSARRSLVSLLELGPSLLERLSDIRAYCEPQHERARLAGDLLLVDELVRDFYAGLYSHLGVQYPEETMGLPDMPGDEPMGGVAEGEEFPEFMDGEDDDRDLDEAYDFEDLDPEQAPDDLPDTGNL
jgi:hypothetical protein